MMTFWNKLTLYIPDWPSLPAINESVSRRRTLRGTNTVLGSWKDNKLGKSEDANNFTIEYRDNFVIVISEPYQLSHMLGQLNQYRKGRNFIISALSVFPLLPFSSVWLLHQSLFFPCFLIFPSNLITDFLSCLFSQSSVHRIFHSSPLCNYKSQSN